ncbi:ubiquitin carboxyl-terminal hydrolase [Pterulicium gracile]|uniref:Ubiquitin carboxyl-terminal hydrolase n=1 Tax=Pterulicium gracile TaxID=1884261 RepID=A0A5C3QW95_9AGAR|nr:ubiquitin carboxyl-terminal hydrolase [Pterula gracilis]
MAHEEDEFESSGWQLTESDPGVFSELLKSLGVPMIVDDLYSLDPASLAILQPLHALIFLFKWLPSTGDIANAPSAGRSDPDFSGFFAHQVVNNACATLAVMNALGNIPSLTCGPQLSELMSFASVMDAQTRGLVITSADWLREAHNALSPPSAVSMDGLGLPRNKSEDVYHFVVYLPVMGVLYELDGLKEHPIKHGSCEDAGEGWVKRAREAIESRIASYPEGSIEFSLLALRDDPLPKMEATLAELQASNKSAEANDLLFNISNEKSKREAWAFENSLRRHNHVGLLHALVHALAKSGKLPAAKENARQASTARAQRRKAAGGAMEED